MSITLQGADWLLLLTHFMTLSLLSIGGAISTVPDMHRMLVGQQAWLTDAQFNASIALAQAAPGPNVLFVALMGWQVGLNAAPTPVWPTAGLYAALGMSLAMLGMLLPSTLLTWHATRWVQRNRERLGIRAFKQGMAAVVVGLMLATSWLMVVKPSFDLSQWPMALCALTSALLVWKTRIHLLWLLAAGALLGGWGWV